MGLFDFIAKALFPSEESESECADVDALHEITERSEEYQPRIEKMGEPLSYGDSIDRRTAKMIAPQLLNQARDSAKILNETSVPAVFFDRYDFLAGTLTRMAELERFGLFVGVPPHVTLRELRSSEKRIAVVNDFVDRYLKDWQYKLKRLKTQPAQIRNLDKMELALEEYSDLMPEESRDRFRRGMEQLRAQYTAAAETVALPASGSAESFVKQGDIKSQVCSNESSGAFFDDAWRVTVTFSKSTSPSFSRALFLAQAAPKYEESEYEGQITYCASYGAAPEQYLAFVRLYELVQNWKTAAVMINGQLVDRKIIGGLNYCYGDRCRTGRSDFCFGASVYTENPFGCHRLQVSAYNTPWHSFVKKEGFWYRLDKAALRERIDVYATAYRLCPAFDYDKVLCVLEDLPERMTAAQLQELSQYRYTDRYTL